MSKEMSLEEIEIIQNKYKKIHEMLNDNISTLYNPHEQVTKEWKIDYSISPIFSTKSAFIKSYNLFKGLS